MPAVSEDTTVVLSSSEKRNMDKYLSKEKRRKRETAPVLIDRVVKEKKHHAVVSPYGDTYNGQEDDDVIEEWTQLSYNDRDETTPLIEQKGSLIDSLRRHFSPLMCFLATLLFAMAMLVCSIWTIPGVFTDKVVIAPNDTIMAAFEVDTHTTDNILYTLPSSEMDKKGELVFYRQRCDYLDPDSVEVNIEKDINVSANVERLELSRLYLREGSSLDYVVNLTLSSPSTTQVVPSDCYAAVHLFKDYFAFLSYLESNDTSGVLDTHRFCNTTTLHFTLDALKSSYYFLGLYTANHGQVESVSFTVSGILFYYDSSFLYDDNLVCTIIPSINSSCTIHTGHVNDVPTVCIVITRGTPNIPGIDPSSASIVAIGNNGIGTDDSYDNNYDDVIRLDRRVTTYWAINRAAVFACLFTPLMIGCCVLTILVPRRNNYGSYVRNSRKKMVNF